MVSRYTNRRGSGPSRCWATTDAQRERVPRGTRARDRTQDGSAARAATDEPGRRALPTFGTAGVVDRRSATPRSRRSAPQRQRARASPSDRADRARRDARVRTAPTSTRRGCPRARACRQVGRRAAWQRRPDPWDGTRLAVRGHGSGVRPRHRKAPSRPPASHGPGPAPAPNRGPRPVLACMRKFLDSRPLL